MLGKKKCSKCGVFLELFYFYKRTSAKDGYSSYCKNCTKDINKRSYANSENSKNKKHRKPKAGYSLADKFPLLIETWDYEKNDISPYDIMPSVSSKVYWTCVKCDYSWEERVNNRILVGNKYDCPRCSNRLPIPLDQSHPQYANWWDDSREMNEFSYGSTVKVRWKCNKGHVFILPIKMFKAKCKQCEIEEKSLNTMYPELAKEYSANNLYKPDELTYNSGRSVLWECSICGHNWKTMLYQRVNSLTGCPRCCNNQYSKAENDIVNFLKEKIGIDSLVVRDKTILNGKELDIYIPSKNIAIEFNGLYWHSEEMGKDNKYHYNKWKECYDKNIQLISIWEDDWNYKKEIVKLSLLHKLGVNENSKVFARNTSVQKIPIKIVKDFCEDNHIQGFTSGSYYIGLVDSNEELVALSIWRKNKNILYLDRYCTDRIVVGGLGKILKSIINTINTQNSNNKGIKIDKIVTFSDNSVSDGNMYRKLGFHLDKEIKPDYSYVVNGRRVHKFNYRISRFKNDSNLIYDSQLSERDLAKLNNISRIWDCGKKRWVIELR